MCTPVSRSACSSLGVALLRSALLLSASLPAIGTPGPWAASQADSLHELMQREQEEASRARRWCRLSEAREMCAEHLELDPRASASRRILAACLADEGDYEQALVQAEQALAQAQALAHGPEVAAAARDLAGLLLLLGRLDRAQAALDQARAHLQPGLDARDAWIAGRVAWERGDRPLARELYAQGVQTKLDQEWEALLARARCERALGRLERASETLVLADERAQAGAGPEPDVLVELGSLYFESEREVESGGKRSAAALFREALELAPEHPGALLGLHELHRVNLNRASRPAAEFLNELLVARPLSIEGRLTEVASALDDGHLLKVRSGLEFLRKEAPGRREVQTVEAALAWVEHRRSECTEVLDALARSSPEDSRPNREVGRHLNELYRFGEARGFLERAVQLDPSDYEAWRELGRSLANLAMESEALTALENSERAAAGRQDAWRRNTILVLERMRSEHTLAKFGELSFSWRPDEAEIFEIYVRPFYEEARSELAARYGYTPGPTQIEIFRRFADFSVRSVGFEGFPALGVCFGPVVTAVSPLSELRGSFSWARTSYHEFTHVIHLGLSHNRCPRWITEGIATWEEEQKNPSWTRNMRRELLHTRANGNLIALRDLNQAFRTSRILFAYYQGGLLIGMLVRDFGFPPIVRLLEAFDRGLDLDQAFAEVFRLTPEEVDQRFLVYVDEQLQGLALEPAWSPETLAKLRFSLPREAPTAAEARAGWVSDLCTLAWGSYQQGRRIDAEDALRRLSAAGERPLRAEHLRGELALAAKDRTGAYNQLRAFYEAGGREFRALIGLGALALERSEWQLAEQAFLCAEKAFPGYDEEGLAAELRLFGFYRARNDEEQAHQALERWLDWNSGEYDRRIVIADWHATAGRHAAAERRLAEANQIDPFQRGLHRRWGDALAALGRHAEARREYFVGRRLPVALEGEIAPAARQLLAEVEADPELAALLGRHPLQWSEQEVELLGDSQRRAWAELRRQDACERLALMEAEHASLQALALTTEAANLLLECEAVRQECAQK